MNLDDYAYFRRRAAQEEEAARSARCNEARICHQDLAVAYRASCARISADLAAPAGPRNASTPVASSISTNRRRQPLHDRDAGRCQIQL